MQVNISYGEFERTDAIESHIETELNKKLNHLTERLTRVEVHLSDENSVKHGPDDKRCLMEARPRGHDPLVAEARGDDLYSVISAAAEKLHRVLEHRFRI